MGKGLVHMQKPFMYEMHPWVHVLPPLLPIDEYCGVLQWAMVNTDNSYSIRQCLKEKLQNPLEVAVGNCIPKVTSKGLHCNTKKFRKINK